MLIVIANDSCEHKNTATSACCILAVVANIREMGEKQDCIVMATRFFWKSLEDKRSNVAGTKSKHQYIQITQHLLTTQAEVQILLLFLEK